jgi:hypothetical protein
MQSVLENHSAEFIPVRDSRNRRVRGLYQRNQASFKTDGRRINTGTSERQEKFLEKNKRLLLFVGQFTKQGIN